MSTTNSRPWMDGEQAPERKTDPWMAFGLALVVSVAAVLFAVTVWIVRSNQAHSAIERAAALRVELAEKQVSSEKQAVELAEKGTQLEQLTADRDRLSEEGARTKAELEAANRSLAAAQAAVTDSRESDENPASLPYASLKHAVPADRTVAVDVHVQGDALAKGAISEYAKDRMAAKWQVQQESPTTLVVSVVVSSEIGVAGAEIRSVAVLMELRQEWKLPGQKLRLPVSIWRNHTIGVTTAAGLAAFIETLMDDLFKAMDSQLTS